MNFPAFKEAQAAGTLPMGQLPVLDIEDDAGNKKTIPQSAAILRYVGKLTGLYPSDPVEAMEVDVVMDAFEDAQSYIATTIKNNPGLCISDEPWPKEQTLEIRAKIMDPEDGKVSFVSKSVLRGFRSIKRTEFNLIENETPPSETQYLKIFENMLVANKTGWFVGDKPTIADLRAHHMSGWLTSGVLDGIPTTCLDAYPMLKALHGKVEALPQVEAFRTEHGSKYTDFDYTP
jgi:glutathione S-transferase